MENALELSAICKSFGGVPVLKNMTLDVKAGEVHALLGENGAGKSTLIKVIAGLHRPDSGVLKVSGKAVQFRSPRESLRCGVATVHQELMLFPNLTVAENIFIGSTPRRRWRGIDWNATRTAARRLLDSLDSHDLDVDENAGTLSVADRQRVEIAKALSHNAHVLIMDEPTASLAEADVSRLMDVVKRLRERGVAIIYVSHRMPEIFELANRVTVLRDGYCVGTHRIDAVTEKQLVSMMVGRSIEQLFIKAGTKRGGAVLELRDVCYGQKVRNVSLTLHRGEILGIAGLVGSGRTELAMTVFGITPARSGEIHVEGHGVRIDSPQVARDLGIAYVPEDRGSQGLVQSMTIRENVSMAVLDRTSRGPFIRSRDETRRANDAIKQLNIRSRTAEQVVRQLSGGNQQKVVLAKWLETSPSILLLDEPTRGIDVGAKAEIYALMSRLAQQGLAILLISSDLPEVLAMSDRILVMNSGQIAAEFEHTDATPHSVGAAMTQDPSRAEVTE